MEKFLESKSNIRKKALQARRNLPENKRLLYSSQLCNHIINSPYFIKAQKIAGYVATNSEICPAQILQEALSTGKSCYLPVLDPSIKRKLLFAKITSNTQLIKNKFGVLEPDHTKSSLIEPALLDLVLVPTVAFDSRKHRIGMGASFYDNTFAFRQASQKPILISIAFQIQQVENVPNDDHDIPLDAIFTENGEVA